MGRALLEPRRRGEVVVMGERRLLTAQQVAERCALSYGTVLRAIHRGELRAARLGARRTQGDQPTIFPIWRDQCGSSDP